MLTWGEDVEVHALRARGWTISDIARHTGRDRKTIRGYLSGERQPGQRHRAQDPFAPYVEYVSARLVEDPHLWVLTLFDELVGLGFAASYQTLTREVRNRGLRPVCAACATATGRANVIIAHPPGEAPPSKAGSKPSTSCYWPTPTASPSTSTKRSTAPLTQKT